ncbi:MAG: fused MFS/spermidine synthase [Planctomycetaceae bacterium]
MLLPPNRHRSLLVSQVLLLLGLTTTVAFADGLQGFGPVVHEVRSNYSHIRVREAGTIRTMSFVRDSGEEVIESQVNFRRRDELRVPYTQYMFLNYLYQPEPKRVLIVGLGGGAMVHWLKATDPEVTVDVLEIDPQVVDIASRYFDVRTGGNIRVLTADAFEFFQEPGDKYDVIYMDAFLKPSEATDSTGVPLALKTDEFYQQLKDRLTEQGVVVFNLNQHRELKEDVAAIRAAFPQVDVYRPTTAHGVIVVADTADEAHSPRDLLQRAGELDRRFRTTFSFRLLARGLSRPRP